MRLDEFLFTNKYFDSRTKAKQAVERKEIYVNDKLVTKSSFNIDENISYSISIKAETSFVSLGGYKLQKSLSDFNFNVSNLVCADIGSSTGGFTDCLLKNGAKKVFAVDLNDDLLHDSLKKDDRVIRIIKNARLLTRADFDDEIDFLCADLSFISATMVLPIFNILLTENTHVILLIKPQFEYDKKKKFKNGIIRDKSIQKDACCKVINCAKENGFCPLNLTTAPLDKEKNVEFLILLKKQDNINQNNNSSFEKIILDFKF